VYGWKAHNCAELRQRFSSSCLFHCTVLRPWCPSQVTWATKYAARVHTPCDDAVLQGRGHFARRQLLLTCSGANFRFTFQRVHSLSKLCKFETQRRTGLHRLLSLHGSRAVVVISTSLLNIGTCFIPKKTSDFKRCAGTGKFVAEVNFEVYTTRLPLSARCKNFYNFYSYSRLSTFPPYP